LSVAEEFHAALARNADRLGPFGERATYVDETGSTNDLALRAAERGAPDGTLFVAGAQTAGRGRLGRTWHSPPGAGLYVSTIVRRLALAPWITLAGGVGVALGIRTATGLPVELKWPNDVVSVTGGAFAARRKIAGILAEASSGVGLQHIVLGFGINVRSSAFPPELATKAGSLESETGRPVDAPAVLVETLAALHQATSRVLHEGGGPLLRQWTSLAPSATGTKIEWDGAAGPRRGVSAGIADDGALLARTSDGVERIIAGEIRWMD
jgi:BirA family biotin operon repressor/biotin-[acetyl-CoA-carboxylase] ligase